jgi:hypothetical protein
MEVNYRLNYPSKNQIILILILVVAAAILCALYFGANDVFWVFVTLVDVSLFTALTYLPLTAMQYGTLGMLGLTLLTALITVLIWHYWIHRWWEKRQVAKQPAVANTITMQREPTPEQQPQKTINQPTTGGTT